MSSPDFRHLPVVDPEAIEALQNARHGDPFSLLGPHPGADGLIVRAFLPGATRAELIEQQGEGLLGGMERVHPYGLYEGRLQQALAGPHAYRLRIHWPAAIQITEDPYAFPAMLDEHDLARFSAGHNWHIGRMLGAHPCSVQGVPGVRFAVWAPNALAVSVVGDVNAWDARRLPMRLRYPSGVWELFVPRLEAGACYKFHVHGRWGPLPLKADPVALQTEKPPSTGSIVARDTGFVWNDAQWLHERGAHQRADAPVSIYEVHAGSWLREAQGLDAAVTSTWKLLAERLVPYVHAMGFTHIELMPVAEHPFGGSWGYQPLGLFAPTARYGTPDEFRHFVDACHRAGLGVIVDWVPAHFPTDVYGLARFDGTALYEHEDPREGYHQDWNTAIYNLGRSEVKSFLISSAMEWIERYHIDGLRVDAVASMLYRDYSRKHGEWVPNVHGGRENLEAIEFLRTFNSVVATHHPGVITVAEESTAWPGVTHGVEYGGLGFSYKWNMGWMHDTLSYMQKDPIYRGYHHDQITFGLLYAFSERFVLPISHDEVVHLKRSLLGKMPGDAWQRLANLRLYLGLMWGYPGKKLLFMGTEIGQESEWSHDHELDWYVLDDPRHQGVQRWLRDLNGAYREHGALHRKDAEADGFEWAVVEDRQNCVFAFLRRGAQQDAPVLVVVNMTPVPRHAYRIGVPEGGVWRELLNSDSERYGGSNLGNYGAVRAEGVSAHARPASLVLTLPPLSALFLQARA